MFTLEQVKEEILAEYKSLNRTWRKVGDVNDIEYGGVRYRMEKSPDDRIEVIYYIGLDNIYDDPNHTIPNKYHTCLDIDDLIEQIPDIWDYADVENCGLDIGWLISSLESYWGTITRN